jgi:class 3 adenylate cyclase/tetratricopeptide (TPR) repeat protein
VTCANCGTENLVGAKFCGECGAPMSTACSSCGTANAPAAKFCSECGTPIDGEVASSASPAGLGGRRAASAAWSSGPVAERRLVSVLFADLVGFTPFAEERDAEDVRAVLTHYFDVASDVIGRYGGTVEKFIGDAVMAVWGAPVAREDDAERAVRAGLELIDAVQALGPGIQARAGVLTGEAAVTLGATNQGMVAGDLVNTASRLQSIAPPGSVLVGEATQRAAAAAIAFEPAGEQLLKGKASPVPAWRALRVVAQRGGHGRSDLPEPPFVGREDEFRILRDALAAVGRDRRARLVSISGPGGIGKSRLAWELEKYIDGILENVYWHRGRSPSYGEGITFWALGEMVRRRAGLAETDDEATTRARITATVADIVPDVDEQRWIEPAMLTLLGFEPPPAGGRDVLFAAWRIFFERIAERGPTILLFEDLQWADSGLLDFVEQLLEWSKGVPILVVTLARPELFDRRPDWGASTRHATSMALDPLSAEAMRELLAGFVPGLPETAVATILTRADGIPLYAVETVRALVSDGRLERVGDVYRPVGELGTLTIPETLRSLIASRLDGLEPIDRTILQDASVLGQAFSLASLAGVASSPVGSLPQDDLERRLRGLVRRELLEVEADPRSPERGQYRFVQSLIREVAYGTLARPDRRARHLAAARYFEALGDDELAGILAGHYLAAHEASSAGEEAEAVGGQARIALRAAAERAIALGANDQGVTFLSQALSVTTSPDERGLLLEMAAGAASEAGDAEAAIALARDGIEAFRAAGDPVDLARATARLGEVLLNGARVGPAIDVLEPALAGLPEGAPDEARARIAATLSRAHMRAGEPAKSIAAAEVALPIAERLNLDQVVADTLNNKGSSLGQLGRTQEGSALLAGAVEIAAQGGYVATELRARSNLGATTWDRDPPRAFEMNRETLDLARRFGSRQTSNWTLGMAITASWLRADGWDDALAEGAEALADARALDDQIGLEASLSSIRLARGDRCDDVLERLRQLPEELASDPNFSSQLPALLAERAVLAGDDRTAILEHRRWAAGSAAQRQYALAEASFAAFRLGDVEELRRLAGELDGLPGADLPTFRAERLRTRAWLAALEGREDEAVVGLHHVLETYRDLGYDLFVARTILDSIRVLGADVLGSALVAEARAIFERVGATPYLAWLDAAVGGAPVKSAPRPTSTGPLAEASERD